MAYDLASLRVSIRASMVNVSDSLLPDASLDEAIRDGLRQLSLDHPREVIGQFTSAGNSYYNLGSLATGWVGGFSQITKVRPYKPNLINDPVDTISSSLYRVYEESGAWYLWTEEKPKTGQFSVSYTVPWQVRDLDGALETTLTYLTEASARFAALYYACQAMATKMAGAKSNQLPGDIINWENKTNQYIRAGKEWQDRYLSSIGLQANVPAPIGFFKDMTPPNSDGMMPLTHRGIHYR